MVATERRRLETHTERKALPPGAEAVIDHAPRCWRCSKPVAWHVARPWSVVCRWCGSTVNSPPD
jgi:hypothetical protein